MINFIICDDNDYFRKNIESIVDKVMMNNKLAYKKHAFEDYNKKFLRIMNERFPCKIYILDIEAPTYSGIDVARMIRNTDVDSIIIFLTSHDELGYTILKNEFMFLSFICKYDDYEDKLYASIKRAITIVGKKSVIRFEEHGVLYTIPMKDIMYITRDSVDRKSLIKTDYSEFRVNKSLSEISDMLTTDFKQSHRACIINMSRVVSVDTRNRTIVFDNGSKSDLLSRNYKKGVLEDATIE